MSTSAMWVLFDDHYGIRRERGFGGGMGRVVIEAPDDMLDRFMGVVDSYGHFLMYNNNGQPIRLGLRLVEEDEKGDLSRQWTDPQGVDNEMRR